LNVTVSMSSCRCCIDHHGDAFISIFFAISLLFDILHKLCFNNFLLNDDEDEDDDDDDGTTDQPWSVL